VKVTTWNRVLEKLIVPQLYKKFSTLKGTITFITVFTVSLNMLLP